MIETIGTRIADLREQVGMTQTELAKRMHISRSSVQSWECGANVPSTDNLISLSQIFHVSTDYLLDLSTNKTVIIDKYNNHEQELFFRMLQYFDETAYEEL